MPLGREVTSNLSKGNFKSLVITFLPSASMISIVAGWFCCISTLKKDRAGLGKILIPNSFNEVVVLTVESIIQAEVSTQPFLEMITA